MHCTGISKREVVLEDIAGDGDIHYYRDDNQVQHVPKKKLDDSFNIRSNGNDSSMENRNTVFCFLAIFKFCGKSEKTRLGFDKILSK